MIDCESIAQRQRKHGVCCVTGLKAHSYRVFGAIRRHSDTGCLGGNMKAQRYRVFGSNMKVQ